MKKVHSKSRVVFSIILFQMLFASIVLTSNVEVEGEIFSTNVQVNIPDNNLTTPSIAVGNDGSIYVAWLENDLSLVTFGDIWVAKSTNGGLSFDTVARVNDDPGNAWQVSPSIAVGLDNKIHVVWTDWRNDLDGKVMMDGGLDGGNNTDIYYANSTDGGLSFNSNVRVDDDVGVEYQGPYASHRAIAVDDYGDIHIVWTDGLETPGLLSVVKYANSTNGGISFNPSVELPSNPALGSSGPTIAIGEANKIHIAWRSVLSFGIYYLNSTDGGISFSKERNITDSSAQPIDTPIIAAGGGMVGIVWKDMRNAGATGIDIFFAGSSDGGKSFGPNLRVNDDTTNSPQGWPSIAINETTHVSIAWFDKRNADFDIYFTSSSDGGSTFGDGLDNNNDFKVNDDVGTEGQWYPSIIMDENGYVYLAWIDWRDGVNGNVFFARSPPELADLEITSGDISFNPSGSVPYGTTVTINATIHNLGDRNASDIVVKFYDGLPGMGNQIGVNQTVSFIQYLGGVGYAEVLWTAQPGGTHDIYVVVDPDNRVTESNETNNVASAPIFVSEYDYIPFNVTPSGPCKVGLGKQLTISAEVKNQGNDIPITVSAIAFYNESSPPFQTYNNVPIILPGTSSPPYLATWTSPMVPGLYNITAEVDYLDQIAESDEDNNTYTIQCDVREGPITSVVLGAPQYGISPVYMTSGTPISFSVIDNSGEGIVSTYYRLDSGGNWVNYTASGQFNIPTEGEHVLYFNSTDGLGNRESTSQFTLRVDDTPPTTSVIVGEPKYRGQADTPINLSSVDGGAYPVGVDVVEYRIDGAAWGTYTQEFNLSAMADGLHTIDYRASDLLGNAEVAGNITVNLDNSPPVSSISPDVENAEAGTTFSISANDSGSGVNYTQYSVDGAGWVMYTAPFTIETGGEHTIRYRSVDNLGNTEVERELPVTIGGPAAEEFNYKPLIALIFSVILLLGGALVSRKSPLKFKGDDGKSPRR
jgi:hypothetical protein